MENGEVHINCIIMVAESKYSDTAPRQGKRGERERGREGGREGEREK